MEISVGGVNPHLSVSVSAPPNVAPIDLIAEGGDPSCPWSIFRSASETSQHLIGHMHGKMFTHDKVKHRVSGPETEKNKKGKQKRRQR